MIDADLLVVCCVLGDELQALSLSTVRSKSVLVKNNKKCYHWLCRF